MLRRAPRLRRLLSCARPSLSITRCIATRVIARATPQSASSPHLCLSPSRFHHASPTVCQFSARRFSTAAGAPAETPRKCLGCGVKLQTEKENIRGYVPLVKFESTVGDIVCYRCWGMRHHNKLVAPEVHDVSVIEKALKDKKCTLIKMVDILDVHGSFIPGFSRLASGLPVVVVGNKFDLMPNGARPDRVKHWLKQETQKLGLSPAQVTDYLLLSSKTGEGFTALKSTLKSIADRATGKDIYVVGTTNVGKSSFIKRLMDRIERKEVDLTVSHFPGTTLDIVSFPLGKDQMIHDTPGVQNANHIVPLLTPEELTYVLPRKCFRPVTYRLLAGKSIFLGGLARVDVVSTSRSPFCYVTFFATSDLILALHATRTERAEDIYRKHQCGLLKPPLPSATSKPRDFPPLEPHRFKVKCTSWTRAECDITLGGAGWVSLTGDGEVTLDVHLPYPVKPVMTPPLMPFELEERREKRIRKHGKIVMEGSNEPPKAEEPKDIDKVQLEEDVMQSRGSLPISLKRWSPSRRPGP